MTTEPQYTDNELSVLWCIANELNTWKQIARQLNMDRDAAGDIIATLANHNVIELQQFGIWVIK